jgi:hypothetical protein
VVISFSTITIHKTTKLQVAWDSLLVLLNGENEAHDFFLNLEIRVSLISCNDIS